MQVDPLNLLGDGIGKVELVDHMGSDLNTVNAARVSFAAISTSMTPRDEKLIQYLANAEPPHGSPSRHAVLQFRFKAPISIARQLYKHVVGIETIEFDGVELRVTTPEAQFKDQPWNEVSGRYVKVEPQFYVPQPHQWRVQAENNKQASVENAGVLTNTEQLTGVSTHLCQLAYDHYTTLLNSGVSREQARLFLPQSTYTEWQWTMSLAAALHLVRLRDHEGAQWEAQAYGKAVGQYLEQLFPVNYRAFNAEHSH